MKTKKKQFDTKTLLKEMMGRQPTDDREDFWVFSIVTDDPATPTWEHRVQVVGSYQQNCRAATDVIDAITRSGFPKGGLRIESYQGEAARAFITEAVVQEARYRQERAAQTNN